MATRLLRGWVSITGEENGVKSYALTLCLKDDRDLIRRYREHHQAVWPEVTGRMREVGIQRMQIFLLGTRMFMYVDADDSFDPATDFQRINEDPKSAEWNQLMAGFQERAPEAGPDVWWAPMERVFDTEWPQHR
ncbi:MAG: L-rhamnose mutarotase [Chloroflexota bacterium]|nr:L-rhamnose mutarotase [Chloroflexota bacterium]